jgi:hypothetical protein
MSLAAPVFCVTFVEALASGSPAALVVEVSACVPAVFPADPAGTESFVISVEATSGSCSFGKKIAIKQQPHD